ASQCLRTSPAPRCSSPPTTPAGSPARPSSWPAATANDAGRLPGASGGSSRGKGLMAWGVRGKTALVTGASSGIGREASVQLARGGALVVMVGRDKARTESALADVIARSGSKEVSHLLCDFSSQAAIRELAAAVLERHESLHILVNNAGGVNRTRRLTLDGIEATFAVNHLGPFLLTNLLVDLLTRSAPARVVTVASVGHRQGSLDFKISASSAATP